MLIDEIITLLGEDSGQLTNALLKTKILLHQIGRKELAVWVNYELNGYPDDAELPEYRVLPSTLLGNVSNGAWRVSEHPLPTGHMKPEYRENCIKAKLHQSLSILEKFGTKGALQREIPPEGYGLLEQGLGNGYRIERAWCQTPSHDIQGVLTQVRSRLLDFLLELKETIGDSDDEESVRKKVDKVDAAEMLHQAVFGNVGDNATFIFGSQNTLAIKNEVHKGDFPSLAQVLTKAGIPDDDVKSLSEAIEDDECKGEVALSKGKTGAWLLSLLERAAKGGLKVGTDVVSHVATEALTKYIGG